MKNKKQKIVHLAKYYPPHKGGIETITSIFDQKKSNYNITFVAFSQKISNISFSQKNKIIRCKVLFSIFSQPYSFRYILASLREIKDADIIHVHAPNIIAFLILLISVNKNIIIHWHSDIIDYHGFKIVINAIEKLVLNKSKRIVCATKNYSQASETLSDYGGKITHIPYGSQENRFIKKKVSLKIKKILDNLGNKKILLSVGRLVKYKGFDDLINLASVMSNEYYFLIIGNGPLKNKLRNKISNKNLTDKIMILDNVPDNDLTFIYKKSSLYLCFSKNRQESFGIALIDALHNRLPIYSRIINGSGINLVNLNGTTGINTKLTNIKLIGEELNQLLNNKKKILIFRDNAYNRYQQLFTKKTMLESFNKLYIEIINVTN